MGSYCDISMKKAKYIAGTQALNKLKEIFGEESLLTKSDKRKMNQIYNKVEPPITHINDEHSEHKLLGVKTAPQRDTIEFKNHMKNLYGNIENNTQHNNIQRNFEIYCTKYERFIIASPNMFEINELTAKLRTAFGKPHFIGSYLYDSLNIQNYVIDIC